MGLACLSSEIFGEEKPRTEMTPNESALCDHGNANCTGTPEAFFMTPLHPVKTTVKAVALSLVSILALTGNILVIIAVYRSPRMRTVTNYLLVNLAVAEALYVSVAMPPLFFEMFLWFNWAQGNIILGEFGCKFFNFGQFMLLAATVFTLAVISVDQFLAIVIPMQRRFTKRVLCVALFLIWSTACAVAAPVLYAYRLKADGDYLYCEEDWTPAFDTDEASRAYTIVLFVFVYCIPFVAMTTMYSVICHRLRVRKAPGESTNLIAKTLTETKQKVVKMLVAVLVAFVVSWLPVQIISFMMFYGGIHVPYDLHFTCTFVMRAHPTLSPCIYAYFSSNFRAGFKDALVWCCESRAKIRATMQPSKPRKPSVFRPAADCLKGSCHGIAKFSLTLKRLKNSSIH